MPVKISRVLHIWNFSYSPVLIISATSYSYYVQVQTVHLSSVSQWNFINGTGIPATSSMQPAYSNSLTGERDHYTYLNISGSVILRIRCYMSYQRWCMLSISCMKRHSNHSGVQVFDRSNACIPTCWSRVAAEILSFIERTVRLRTVSGLISKTCAIKNLVHVPSRIGYPIGWLESVSSSYSVLTKYDYLQVRPL